MKQLYCVSFSKGSQLKVTHVMAESKEDAAKQIKDKHPSCHIVEVAPKGESS